MAHQTGFEEQLRREAQRVDQMLNELSLFSRKTLLKWLPEMETEMGITEERFMVLFELNLEPNISLKELSQHLVISSSSLSVMINSLVEQGLVLRVTDPQDRRRILLRLSDNGHKVYQMADEHMVNRFQEYLRSLSEKDRHDFQEATTQMLQVMDRLLRPAGEKTETESPKQLKRGAKRP